MQVYRIVNKESRANTQNFGMNDTIIVASAVLLAVTWWQLNIYLCTEPNFADN